MAKQNAPTATVTGQAAEPAAKKEGSKKVCPDCNKSYHNRTSKCECGYSFRGAGLDVEKEVLKYTVQHCKGNVKAAIKAIEEYETDKLGQLLAAVGGKDKALAALKTFDT